MLTAMTNTATMQSYISANPRRTTPIRTRLRATRAAWNTALQETAAQRLQTQLRAVRCAALRPGGVA
jgi:hypothetical protein